MSGNLIVFDADTQKDFIDPDSEFCVKYTETQLNNINTVLVSALRKDTIITGSLYSCKRGFCVEESGGYEKIPETNIVDSEISYTVANLKHGMDMNLINDSYQILFEKQTDNIWHDVYGQPDNLGTLLRTEDISTIVIVGVNKNYSIVHLIQGLKDRRYNVILVEDAVIGETYDNIIPNVNIMKTEEVIKLF